MGLFSVTPSTRRNAGELLVIVNLQHS